MYASLNNVHYREVRSDYPSDIFPKAACKRTELGDGDTFFSVKQIVIAIDTYYTQCRRIAKLLKGDTLQATCRNIHQFLYHHFQYKADSEEQQLRSPACSWAQRFIGIDCKSYTILAGAIIKALGYNSYVRQIKQPYSSYPDQYTHVYLIVPISQKDNDLRKGYYVIDGTVSTTREAIYSEKADEIVTAMKHIGLNGAQNALYDFRRSKGLGDRADGNAAAGAGSTTGTGKSYSDTRTKRIVDGVKEGANDLLDLAKIGKQGYDIFNGNNNRPNPVPGTSPSVDNTNVKLEYERKLAELQELRKRNAADAQIQQAQAEMKALQDSLRRQQEQIEREREDVRRQQNQQNQNINPYYLQQSNPNGKSKDNTMIYVIGGVAVVGILVVVMMMNKK